MLVLPVKMITTRLLSAKSIKPRGQLNIPFQLKDIDDEKDKEKTFIPISVVKIREKKRKVYLITYFFDFLKRKDKHTVRDYQYLSLFRKARVVLDLDLLINKINLITKEKSTKKYMKHHNFLSQQQRRVLIIKQFLLNKVYQQ